MPTRWSPSATLRIVQLDYENTPKERPVRLSGPTPVIGHPVRIGMSGVEIEGRIARIDGPVLHVKVKAAALPAPSGRRKRSA